MALESVRTMDRMSLQVRQLAWWLGLALACWALERSVDRVEAEDTSQKLAAAVGRLTDWLEASPDSESWRVYLELNAVETFVGRGYRADANDLLRVAERFSGGHPSLAHPNFRSVGELLREQARRIQQAELAYPEATYTAGDLSAWADAFRGAAAQLRPMTSQEANHKRILVLTEVQALRQYLIERGPGFVDYISPPPVLATIKNEPAAGDAGQVYAEQMQQLDLLIRWLQVPVSFPWEASGATAQRGPVVGQIGDEVAAFRIGDRVEELIDNGPVIGGSGIRQVGWQDDAFPADPSLNDVLSGLRQQQLWLQKNARRDPNPYAAYPAWLLNDYLTGINLGRRENLSQLLARQLENLAVSLEQWHGGGDRNKQAEVARVVGLLESIDQATELTTAFRRTFWRNNAAVYVGETLVNQLAARPVNETQPVYEVILDNQVFGTANTQGQVRIDFIPDATQAHVSLQLTGLVNSDNYTPAGPITAFTGSQAQVEARRSLYVNAGGWYQRAPYGAANLQSYFKGTSCGRIVDRLAEAQFLSQQDAAEAIGARRAENRLLRQFEQQTSEALAKGRQDLKQQRQSAGMWRSVRPTTYFLTDENFFQVYMKKHASAQTLALGSAPPITVPSDLAVQIHESFLTNFLEDELAGLRLTHEDIARIETELREAARQSGAAGQIGDQPATEREPFELALANSRPVEVRFDSQSVQVVLNVRNFRAQGQSINDAQVLVRLQFESDAEDPQRVRFRQVGEIKASLLDPDKIDLNTATVLDLIETTINREIRRQQESRGQQAQGMVLPGNLIDPAMLADLEDLQLRSLATRATLTALRFDQGWATVAWRIPTSGGGGQTVDLAGLVSLTRERLLSEPDADPTHE